MEVKVDEECKDADAINDESPVHPQWKGAAYVQGLSSMGHSNHELDLHNTITHAIDIGVFSFSNFYLNILTSVLIQLNVAITISMAGPSFRQTCVGIVRRRCDRIEVRSHDKCSKTFNDQNSFRKPIHRLLGQRSHRAEELIIWSTTSRREGREMS